MLSKKARLRTELSFLQIEKEKELELIRVRMIKELAANQAEIEAMEKLEQLEQVYEHSPALTPSDLPDQVETPIECVPSYVKEQSDSVYQLDNHQLTTSHFRRKFLYQFLNTHKFVIP
jgi:hypothetical protein